MGERSFTYDHVFGPQVAQGKLYELTARPMLKPFLEGYNVTIIAYGQTGGCADCLLPLVFVDRGVGVTLIYSMPS